MSRRRCARSRTAGRSKPRPAPRPRWVSHTRCRVGAPPGWPGSRGGRPHPSRRTSSSGMSSGSLGSPSNRARLWMIRRSPSTRSRTVARAAGSRRGRDRVEPGAAEPVRRYVARWPGGSGARPAGARGTRVPSRPPDDIAHRVDPLLQRTLQPPLDRPGEVGLLVTEQQDLRGRGPSSGWTRLGATEEGVGERHALDALLERHRQLEHGPRRWSEVVVWLPLGRNSVWTPTGVGDDQRPGADQRPGGEIDRNETQSLPYPLMVSIINSCGRSVPPGCSGPEVEQGVLELPESGRRQAPERHRCRHDRPRQ